MLDSTNGRILVIDDNPAIHEDFRKIFNPGLESEAALAGVESALFGETASPAARPVFQIDWAFQGQEGVALVRQAQDEDRPYAMAFVDVRMPPGWDGVETIAKIWEYDPEVQIVMCTAYSDYSWGEIQTALGDSDRLLILKKPFDNAEVLQLAATLTEKWQFARQIRQLIAEQENRIALRTSELDQINRELLTEVAAHQRAEAKLASVLESIDDVVWSLDLESRKFLYLSPAAERVYGRPAADFLAQQDLWFETIHPQDIVRVLAAMSNLPEADTQILEHRILWPGGDVRWLENRMRITRDETRKPVRADGVSSDITERKAQERQIKYLATHDALTGLPNRYVLNDRIAQSIAQARRNKQRLAVLVLDLDRFKFINDSFGYAVGDALLNAVAAKLKTTVREADTVARLGSNQFVIVLPYIAQPKDAAAAAEKILATLSFRPFLVENYELCVSASLGISLYPEDGDNSDPLLKNADIAMYRAKESGRGGIQFYTQEMGVQLHEQVKLENALRLALERHEFELHYQPQVNLRSGIIQGVEALIRWRHPEFGLVAPDRFIPLAEGTGLIVPIGEWVLRTACAQVKAWHAEGYSHLTMAVNLSTRQFHQQDMAELVRRVLAETGLAAAYLELELTESLLIEDSEHMIEVLHEIKAIGVELSLDDFGTGYSSLSYLKRFPIDSLKIDRSFVRDVTHCSDDASLTKAIIAMAQSLNMKTVAEGVETEGQLSFLLSAGCDTLQGYYFSRPLPAPDITALLRADKRLGSNF